MALRWERNDGYTDSGARVAMVDHFREPIVSGTPDVVVPASWFWVALVLHDYVEIDGAPGRWKTRVEAVSAAEAAWEEHVAAGGEIPAPAPPHPSEGLKGWLRDLWRGWRASRQSSSLVD